MFSKVACSKVILRNWEQFTRAGASSKETIQLTQGKGFRAHSKCALQNTIEELSYINDYLHSLQKYPDFFFNIFLRKVDAFFFSLFFRNFLGGNFLLFNKNNIYSLGEKRKTIKIDRNFVQSIYLNTKIMKRCHKFTQRRYFACFS